MNKKDLIHTVAKRAKVPVLLADDIVELFLELVTLNLSVGEEVALRGFGRLETRERGAKTLKHPTTGEPLPLGPYRTVVFLPSDKLKDRLNNPPGLGEVERYQQRFHYRRPRKPQPKQTREMRRTKRHHSVHKLLWERRDGRNRIALDIGDLAANLGIHYDTANALVIEMRQEGRIRSVGWRHPRTRIYEVSNPDVWDPDDPETHRPPPPTPAWG